jgi:alpha-tubulin suppressor-like RCC1 family protein
VAQLVTAIVTTSKLAPSARRSCPIAVTALVALSTLGCDGSSAPTTTPPLAGVAAVTTGGDHACARLADGTARCWGDDAFGELGDDAMWTRPPGTPVAVNLTGIVGLAAGGYQTCAVLGDTTVSCWGDNIWGELGNGQRSLYDTTLAQVPGLTGVAAIAATGPSRDDSEVDDEFSCALLANGQAFCWGNDGDGALGDGGSAIDVPSPVAVAGLTGATQLALGGSHACALLSDRTVTCWGNDLFISSPIPTSVAGLSDVAELTTGSVHACALFVNGSVSCWGDHTFGQIGDGMTSLDLATPPTPVTGLSGVTAISAAGDHTCALLGGGTVRCWGIDDHGELGDGTSADFRASPTPVKGLVGAVAISAGIQFSCALLGDGTVRCWGNNESGQLGNGSQSTIDVPTPVAVVNGS